MPSKRLSRRALLGTAGVVAGGALAGCGFIGSGDGGSGNGGLPRLDAVEGAGRVRGDPPAVEAVTLVMRKTEGSPDVGINDLAVEWAGPSSEYELLAAGGGGDADGRFGIEARTDTDGSAPVANDPADRLALLFDPGKSSTDGGGVESFGRRLSAGATVTARLRAGERTAALVTLAVPDSLSGTESADLLV